VAYARATLPCAEQLGKGRLPGLKVMLTLPSLFAASTTRASPLKDMAKRQERPEAALKKIQIGCCDFSDVELTGCSFTELKELPP